MWVWQTFRRPNHQNQAFCIFLSKMVDEGSLANIEFLFCNVGNKSVSTWPHNYIREAPVQGAGRLRLISNRKAGIRVAGNRAEDIRAEDIRAEDIRAEDIRAVGNRIQVVHIQDRMGFHSYS